MSNTIDLSLSADNRMKALSFQWIAFFKDGSSIPQFDFHSQTENLFKLIQDKLGELKYFMLRHSTEDIIFTVDLINGIILIGKNQEIAPELVKEKTNIRLIYFRRVRNEIGEADMKVMSTEITHFLGFQYLENGINKKLILQIDKDGNCLIGDNQ